MMNIEIRILYDTSALLEFFLGSKEGDEVNNLFLDNEVENLIPAAVFSELISKMKRTKIDPAKFIKILEQNATVLELDLEIATIAGNLHAELKAKEANISIIDCIIMAHGEVEGAMIITKDSHFKHYKNVKLL